MAGRVDARSRRMSESTRGEGGGEGEKSDRSPEKMDAIYANKMRPTSRYECGDVETVASEKVWRGEW